MPPSAMSTAFLALIDRRTVGGCRTQAASTGVVCVKPQGPWKSQGMRMGGGKKKSEILHRDQRRGGMRTCFRGVPNSHPNPMAVPSATYIVAQCCRLDLTRSGETQHAPLEAPTSMKLPNQMHWSHFGE